jgi:hypothetical protein
MYVCMYVRIQVKNFSHFREEMKRHRRPATLRLRTSLDRRTMLGSPQARNISRRFRPADLRSSLLYTNLCVCVCACVYELHFYTYYMFFMYACMHVYTYVCMHHTCLRMHVSVQRASIYTYTCIHVCAHGHVHLSSFQAIAPWP